LIESQKIRKESMNIKSAAASDFFLPYVSAIKPDGISNKLVTISLEAYRIPICVKLMPLSIRNRIKKASKNLRFFKKP